MTKEEKEGTAIKNLRIVLGTPAGMNFFRFLLEEYDVLGAPPTNLTPQQLAEEVAFRRMGSFILGYITKAEPSVLGHLIGQIAKDKQNEYAEQNSHIKDEPTKADWER